MLDPQDGTRDYDEERRSNVTTMTRRRSRRDEEPEDERDERPTRRRRSSSDDEPQDEAPRRRRSRDDSDGDEPTRGRSRSRSRDDRDEESPRRSRRSRDDDADESPRRSRRNKDDGEGGSRRGRASRGFGSYSSKKRASGFAGTFQVKANEPVLIKILDEEPFDSFNEHWLDDMPKGERKSYICLDDDYFGPEDTRDDCPLCDIGDKAKTYALFNVLDLSNPRKPEVKIWKASPAVADHLERAAGDKKTSPINREDLYWEVELTKKGKRYQWVLLPVKARDLVDDYDMDPLEPDEIEEFSNDLFDDRAAVTKVDSFDDLLEVADSLD